jgi:hypothetical protein
VQRKGALVFCCAAVRDNTGGIKAETSLMEGEPELHAHQRVVEAHCGHCVRVGGKIQNREGCVLFRGLELGKGTQCQGRAEHAGEAGQATLGKRERSRNLA